MSKILLYLGFDYFSENPTGVGAYHANIIYGLHCDYDIIVPEYYTAKLPRNAHPVIISRKKNRMIKVFKRFLPIDVFFKEYDIAILNIACFKHSKRTVQISIVHDLQSFTEPYNFTLKKRMLDKFAVKTYKNADVFISVSQATKQALHECLGIDFNKIFVIPNVTKVYVKRNPKDFFLYIGDMRKSKNLVSLILGFAEYAKKQQRTEKLIIAGSKKYEYMQLESLVSKLNLSDRIIFPGYISDMQKKDYFSAAKALVFLSDNEGFGTPLIEACTNGIPVLCSDIPIFHEVIDEDCAIYVNNKNPLRIAEGLELVTNKAISSQKVLYLRDRYSEKNFSEKINFLINVFLKDGKIET